MTKDYLIRILKLLFVKWTNKQLRTVLKQMEKQSFSKEIEDKKNKMEILELKNTATKIKLTGWTW